MVGERAGISISMWGGRSEAKDRCNCSCCRAQEICGAMPTALSGLRTNVLRHLPVPLHPACVPAQDGHSVTVAAYA